MDELSKLVLRCVAGTTNEEMNQLLEAVYPDILFALETYCGKDSSVEDFAQEAMGRIVRNIKKSRAESIRQFGSWCRTIAIRVAVDHYRKPGVRKLLILNPTEIQKLREEGSEDEDSKFGLSIDADRALKVLESIGSPCRELLTLYYIQDLNYNDIAKIMGKTPDAVRVAIARCRREAQAKFKG